MGEQERRARQGVGAGTASGGSERLKQLAPDPFALLREIDRLTDFDLWIFATMAVVCAGKRAQNTGRNSVEQCCLDYVHTMHQLVGTPPLKTARVQ